MRASELPFVFQLSAFLLPLPLVAPVRQYRRVSDIKPRVKSRAWSGRASAPASPGSPQPIGNDPPSCLRVPPSPSVPIPLMPSKVSPLFGPPPTAFRRSSVPPWLRVSLRPSPLPKSLSLNPSIPSKHFPSAFYFSAHPLGISTFSFQLFSHSPLCARSLRACFGKSR